MLRIASSHTRTSNGKVLTSFMPVVGTTDFFCGEGVILPYMRKM